MHAPLERLLIREDCKLLLENPASEGQNGGHCDARSLERLLIREDCKLLLEAAAARNL